MSKRGLELVKALEKSIRTGSKHEKKAKRLELNQYLEAKHMGCIVRDRLRAVGCEGIRAAGWARVVETQRDNDATVRSLGNQHDELINKPDERCKVFQEHFA